MTQRLFEQLHRLSALHKMPVVEDHRGPRGDALGSVDIFPLAHGLGVFVRSQDLARAIPIQTGPGRQLRQHFGGRHILAVGEVRAQQRMLERKLPPFALASPALSFEDEMALSRAAALMRALHRPRKSPFR